MIFLAIGLYNQVKRTMKRTGALPGPPVHPLLGNFLTMTKLSPVPHYAWDSLTRTFGKIVRLRLGQTYMVVLGGWDVIKLAMNNDRLDDRGGLPTPNLIRFTLKSLRDLGLGKTGSEEAIIEETKVLVQ